MTSGPAYFPKRFTRIDALTRPDHYYLEEGDHCYFLGEYTARKGFSHSATNKLIINFKKPMDRRGRPEWRYKHQSIETAATALYDDRVAETLRIFSELNRTKLNREVHICEAVVQSCSMEAAHDGSARPNPPELVANYQIDAAHAKLLRTHAFIFDDVLTTGCHYKAMVRRIADCSPSTSCVGLFLARRAPEAVDFAAMF